MILNFFAKVQLEWGKLVLNSRVFIQLRSLTFWINGHICDAEILYILAVLIRQGLGSWLYYFLKHFQLWTTY